MNAKGSAIVQTCSTCGAKNRIPLSRLNDGPKCGDCGTMLALDTPQHVSTENFDQVVLESGLPVLVDFWAPWCGPCRMIAPALEQIAKKFAGKLVIAKVNTDEEPSLGAKYRITGIPTLLLFKDGEIADQIVGAMPAQQLEKWVSARL